jgi:hypothetical protein
MTDRGAPNSKLGGKLRMTHDFVVFVFFVVRSQRLKLPVFFSCKAVDLELG